MRERAGCTRVRCRNSPRKCAWLPEYIRARLPRESCRRIKGAVQVVQIDGLSGKRSVEEAVAAIVDGEISSSHSEKNDEWLSIEPPLRSSWDAEATVSFVARC